MLEAALICVFSLIIDQLLGEPRKYHPLAGFGRCAHWFDAKFNDANRSYNRLRGLLSVLLLLGPVILLSIILTPENESGWLFSVFFLYLVIGRKSLIQHVTQIRDSLSDSDIVGARKKLSYIVSRDTKTLDQQSITKAAIESLIENSNDAIFAPIFWFLIAGVPGAICYRMVNTLDAMWGYKNKRYKTFGWFAARTDDLMNWIPARLTIISFAIFGSFFKIIFTALRQGKQCSSPNAGPVMAAGAANLNIILGGEAYYQGELIAKPELGYGNKPDVSDFDAAVRLVDKSIFLWLLLLMIFALLVELL